MLGLLDAVEQERARSRRNVALEFGIAFGVVNAYLKRCISKDFERVIDSLTLREDRNGFVRRDVRSTFQAGDALLLGRNVRVTVDVNALAAA